MIATGAARRRLARVLESGTILDVGCGDFAKAYRYLYGTNRALRFVGLERFRDATIYGESTVPPAVSTTGAFRRLACDVENEPFPLEDASVDGVFCSHMIEHVRDRPLLLREMDRVLRPGGYAYIETPGPRSLWMPAHSPLQRVADAAGYPLNFNDDTSHVGAPVSPRELRALVEAQHWRVVRAGDNRELGIAALPLYAAMFAAGLLPVLPKRVRGLLLGAGWWNLVGWPTYVLARKAPSS